MSGLWGQTDDGTESRAISLKNLEAEVDASTTVETSRYETSGTKPLVSHQVIDKGHHRLLIVVSEKCSFCFIVEVFVGQGSIRHTGFALHRATQAFLPGLEGDLAGRLDNIAIHCVNVLVNDPEATKTDVRRFS